MQVRHSRSARVAELGQVAVTSRRRVILILSVPALSLLLPGLAVEIASSGGSGLLTRIAAATASFLLFYSGVFALIGLSAAVAAGLLATDRIVMTPERRIVAQAVHRTMSLIGMSALANHIMLEIMASRARVVDGFIPFMAARSTFYLGLGTLSSDLFVLIVVTGVLRRRFVRGSRRTVWRVLHLTTYVAWPMAILHGLLAGRHAKPYVDWSYGACLALVALALIARYAVLMRGHNAAPAGRPAATPAPRSWPAQLGPGQSWPAQLGPGQSWPGQPWPAQPWPAQPSALPASTAQSRPAPRALPAASDHPSGPLHGLPAQRRSAGPWPRPPRRSGARWSEYDDGPADATEWPADTTWSAPRARGDL